MTPGEWMTLAGVGLSVLALAGGVIIWAVRLEGQNKVLSVRLDALEKRQDADELALTTARSAIESQISNGFRDIRTDLNRIFDRLDDKVDKPR
jgi:hypothetical protein